MHPRVAVDLARWCSPEFAVWMDGWFLEMHSRPPVQQPLEDGRLYEDQFVVRTEAQLHAKVVDFVRAKYPDALLVPGLGETGATPEARIANWRKGYQAGCPDLFVVHRHPRFSGIALEFKHPGGLGCVSEKQAKYLGALEDQGWLSLTSQRYDDIVLAVYDYMREASVACPQCGRGFATHRGLGRHVSSAHGSKRARVEEDLQPGGDQG